MGRAELTSPPVACVGRGRRYLVASGLVVVALQTVCTGVGVAGEGSKPARATREPVPLVTTVTWTGPDGKTGSMQFQGTSRGRRLRGIALAEGQELRVEGTIARDGTVSGTLTSVDGEPVGTFTARLDAQKRLQGAWVVTGGGGGSIEAPADALPIRSRRPATEGETKDAGAQPRDGR